MFQIEALSNFLLYTEFVIIPLMSLLTTMQLFVVRLLSALVTAILMSLLTITQLFIDRFFLLF
jgi:hypothetical protein